MRAPKRKRAMVRRLLGAADSEAYRQELADCIAYVGSPEHKDVASFAGNPPRPRPDASICPRDLADGQDRMTAWIQEAVRRGAYGEMRENGFPRYLWYKEGDTVYEGRLVNSGQGTYKGYPLEEDEWPPGIEDFYD